MKTGIVLSQKASLFYKKRTEKSGKAVREMSEPGIAEIFTQEDQAQEDQAQEVQAQEDQAQEDQAQEVQVQEPQTQEQQAQEKQLTKAQLSAIEFKDLEAEDLERYRPFYGLRPNKTADSVPLESYLWKDYYNARAAVAHRDGKEVGLLWLYGTEEDAFAAMPLCRDADMAYCFNEIKLYFNTVLRKPLMIKLADEEAIQVLQLSPSEFQVKEETDFRDYIYDGEAMRTLAGKKLHKKKNHYNKFVKEYEGRYEYRTLDCSCRDAVFAFLAKWRDTKGEDAEQHLDYEVEGIHNILKNCAVIRAKMGGIYIDGELQAFSIGSLNESEDMAVIHIEKANPEIDGLYQVINREFLLHEFPSVHLINREDDVGLEGLRKSKLSYFPIEFAKKYAVIQL